MKKSKTYKGLLIERKEGEDNRLIFSLIDINRDNSLAEIYEALKCDTIDIQERYINGETYNFIIDDEYLLNGKSQEPKNAVAIGTHEGKIQEVIYGSLFICRQADKDGAKRSLRNKDIGDILENGRIWAKNEKNGQEYEMIGYTFTDEKTPKA